VDYRKLLGKVETLVLPYFGGASVDAEGRRLRVEHQGPEPAPGWWRFEVRGRDARPLAPAGDEEAAAVRDTWPPVRGHLVGAHLVQGGALAEPVHFLPEEEAPALSVCRARRSWSTDLCFEMLDFDGEAEEQARRALEEGSPLRGVKGVAASLRAAFGMALMGETARRAGVPMAALEVRQHMLRVADEGAAAAAEVVAALARERAENERRAAAERSRRDAQMVASQVDEARRRARRDLGALDDHAARRLIGARVEDALSAAGARYRNLRRLEAERFEVTFEFLGQRFITVVDGNTLGVIDAGICLSGSDREVTLESLPSVIREAVDTRRLVITRR
jgi:hypothetical protein